MKAQPRPGVPLALYLVLVLLFAPMIALGGVWAWVILSGLFHLSDAADLRGAGMIWMTILVASAAICILSEILLIPYVMGSAKKASRAWVSAPLSLAAGLFAGAAGYVFLGRGAEAASTNPIEAALFVNGSPNWVVIAPLTSALIFALAAGFTVWALRPRKGDSA
jgi:hypothetical protein